MTDKVIFLILIWYILPGLMTGLLCNLKIGPLNREIEYWMRAIGCLLLWPIIVIGYLFIYIAKFIEWLVEGNK